eukprot:973938-Amphidinium_carterae.1
MSECSPVEIAGARWYNEELLQPFQISILDAHGNEAHSGTNAHIFANFGQLMYRKHFLTHLVEPCV